jgi:hypothetical protein
MAWLLNGNKIGTLCSFEYMDILNVLLTLHLVGQLCTNVILCHCCAVGRSCTGVIRGHCYESFCSNSGLVILLWNTSRNEVCGSQSMQVTYCHRRDMTDRETYMDGPIKCSLLKLEHEERLIIVHPCVWKCLVVKLMSYH